MGYRCADDSESRQPENVWSEKPRYAPPVEDSVHVVARIAHFLPLGLFGEGSRDKKLTVGHKISQLQ